MRRAVRMILIALLLVLPVLGCSRSEDARLATPTPTATATSTATLTPTAVVTPTAALTPTASVTPTATPSPTATSSPVPSPTPTLPPSPWASAGILGEGEVFLLAPEGPRRIPAGTATGNGLLIVDLSDGWAPFVFSEGGDGALPPWKLKSSYRPTYVALANDQTSGDDLFLTSAAGRSAVLSTVPPALRSKEGEKPTAAEEKVLARAHASHALRQKANFLEVYGIPPSLSVLARRVNEDLGKSCYRDIDVAGIRELDIEISFQRQDQARFEFERTSAAAMVTLEDGAADPAALDAAVRAKRRLRAIHAVQARLGCEGLLVTDAHAVPGSFDLPTHLALADFEKKNDVFGWGFVSGETRETLLRDPLELHLQTFRRILAERVAEAAGIVEDGSASVGGAPVTYVDEAGVTRAVPNLVEEHVVALTAGLGISSAQELARFLAERGASFANLRVALTPPKRPPYYSTNMDLSVVIDRGDIWYDVPFDAKGRPIAQPRQRYPHLTLYTTWQKQKIPLVRWRTTIGSWRSELQGGRVYLKYKSSDVGPRLWKNVVAAPAWVPPPSVPGKDLLTKKVFDRSRGPVTVVNTEVMGPGFASAFGLVMAIHLKALPGGGLFDNQIRTHGSVDYTSIARRFSHGCHRLVNNRAVRLFGFVLGHRPHRRLGDKPVVPSIRRFRHAGRSYRFDLPTRGYYYELTPPVPIVVTEGRIRGAAKRPITAYVPKSGVDYGKPPADVEPASLP